MESPLWRSLLFVPVDNLERCEKAARSGADAVILDLEDGVAADRKPAARAHLSEASSRLRDARAGVVVRINAPWALAVEDLRAALAAGADAIMVPKAEDAARLSVITEMAAEWGASKSPGLIALIESPMGVAALNAIAGVESVVGLALGTEDFSLAMGVAPSPTVLDLPSRLIALAAAERGMMALAVPLSIAVFRDGEAYESAARAGKAYGVNGAICIHPAQVAVANTCFGAAREEIAEARRVLMAWDEARAAGKSVVALDGRMIDLPVAERARRLIARSP